MIVPFYLFEPYQKIGFIVSCWRITSSVMASFSNKVVVLLLQRINIAREQMVVVCREPLVLKMLDFYRRLVLKMP